MFTLEVARFVEYMCERSREEEHWKFLDYEAIERRPQVIRRGGILVSLDLGMYNHYVEPTKSKHAMVYFVLCSNTSVFALCTKERCEHRLDWSAFENTSNHDSCWRSSGIERVLNSIYFAWSSEIGGDLAPRDLHTMLWSTKLQRQPQQVVVSYQQTEDHWNKLVGVEFVPKRTELCAPPGQFRIVRECDKRILVIADVSNIGDAETTLNAIARTISLQVLSQYISVLSLYDDKGTCLMKQKAVGSPIDHETQT